MTDNKPEPQLPTFTSEDVQKAMAALKADFLMLLDQYVEPVSLFEEIDLDGMKAEMDAAFETMKEELTFSEKDLSDFETEQVLNMLDSDDVLGYVRDQFPAMLQVRIESIEKMEKLRAFLEAEIFPFYSEQRDNILF